MLRWTCFLMIPLSFLYDEYIDRPKLSEQKKPIWIYSSSSIKVGWNNNGRLKTWQDQRRNPSSYLSFSGGLTHCKDFIITNTKIQIVFQNAEAFKN